MMKTTKNSLSLTLPVIKVQVESPFTHENYFEYGTDEHVVNPLNRQYDFP